MKKTLIILGLGAFLVIISGITYYLVVQLPAKKLAEIELEKVKLMSKEAQTREEELASCLENVEKDYKRKVELNSVLSPTEDYPDARRWNSSQVNLAVEEKYNDDRDFCLDRYK